MSMIKDFFTQWEDKARYCDATEQDAIEKAFDKWFELQMNDSGFASSFLMEHLLKHYHPHVTAIVNSSRVEILEGLISHINKNV